MSEPTAERESLFDARHDDCPTCGGPCSGGTCQTDPSSPIRAIHRHLGCPTCWWFGALATLRKWF